MTTDQDIAAARWARSRGRVIDDAVARAIASDWQGGPNPALHAFTATGTILPRLLPEIRMALACVGFQVSPGRSMLLALRTYVEVHGPRESVPGWSNLREENP